MSVTFFARGLASACKMQGLLWWKLTLGLSWQRLPLGAVLAIAQALKCSTQRLLLTRRVSET